MKPYLIFSDETEKKLSFNSCWKNKIEETARVLEKTPKVSTPLLEYGKIAYFHFQQDQDQALFSPGCLWKELAYSWPACFENLSPSLLHSAPVHAGVRGKNSPSGLTPSNWHSQVIELTVNGVWPGKWSGHNKPLTRGSPSVTHTHTHIPLIQFLSNTHTLTQTWLPSSCFSPLAWLNPPKNPPVLHLTCLHPEAGGRSWVSTAHHFSDKCNYRFMT